MLPVGKQTVEVSLSLCLLRREDHIIRIHAVLLAQALAERLRRSDACHQSRFSPTVWPVTVMASVQQAEIAQVEHHLRHTAQRKARTVG